MTPSETALLAVTVALNGVLWAQYAAMGIREQDFGDVRHSGTRVYMLAAASVAYACLLAFVGGVVAARQPATRVQAVTWCVGA